MTRTVECSECGEAFPRARHDLGYRVCLRCGDAYARAQRKTWTVAPMHKSNYVLVTRKEDLIGMNNKGGNVRTG